jgi:hypothetical protein
MGKQMGILGIARFVLGNSSLSNFNSDALKIL